MSENKSAAREAREQAEAYESLLQPHQLKLSDGSTIEIPPHPELGLLDDDAQEAYEELLFEVDTECEREPDIIIPEHDALDKDGKKTGAIMPEETIRGALKRPLRKIVDGKPQRISPPHSVRVAQAALGEENYKRLRAGGKSAGDVWRIWSKQLLEVQLRQGRDPKSDGSSEVLEAVAPPDSE